MVGRRGSDATSTVVSGNAGLGHSRLSIIDLAGGGQPRCNEKRSLWIPFNGEIFNYRNFGPNSFGFTTQSDTEVILHLFEDEGEDCVRRLNGQWAFAIWDVRPAVPVPRPARDSTAVLFADASRGRARF